MNISCNIIRDLLPLYAEDMVSQDSRDMVEEHLGECESCTRELEGLKALPMVPGDADTQALKRVKRTIRRKRILSVLTALLFTITVILAGALLMDARIYLNAEEAVEGVQVLEDGRIRILWSGKVIGHGGCQWEDGDNSGVIGWTCLRKLILPDEQKAREPIPPEMQTAIPEEFFGSSTYPLTSASDDWNVWYVRAADGTGEKLLWDAGKTYNGEPLLGSLNYHLAWYAAILGGICALAFAVRFVMKLRWKPWLGELCFRIGALAGCLSLSTVIVTAGQFMELWGEFTEGVQDGSILALPMVFTVLFARQLYLLTKQEGGM